MRTFGPAVALLTLTSGLSSAPVPKPKPGLSTEQEAVLKAAEAEMQAAAGMVGKMFNDIRSRFASAEEAQAEVAETMRKVQEAYRAPAEKLTRLDGELTRCAKDVREAVAFKALKAWHLAGEHEKALAFCDRLVRESRDAIRRVQTLQVAVGCRFALKAHDRIPPLVELARKELPRLSEKERAEAEAWLSTASKIR